MIEKQQQLMIPRLTIEVAVVVILVNYSWVCLYVYMIPNMKDIAERGWFLLNCNFLLDTQLWATITAEEQDKESTSRIIIHYHKTANYVVINDFTPT